MEMLSFSVQRSLSLARQLFAGQPDERRTL